MQPRETDRRAKPSTAMAVGELIALVGKALMLLLLLGIFLLIFVAVIANW